MPIYCLLILLLSISVAPLWADPVQIAVASSFAGPIKPVADLFAQKTGHHLNIATGASGKFYVQIRNGAPFEVLLSADDAVPSRLEQEHLAVAGSRFTYAIGRLVLWSDKTGWVDDTGNVLRQGRFDHLALANPKVAPYGAAAVEVLRKLGLLETLSPRFVLGENVAQAQQFIRSGNAELGFIALSQVEENGQLTAGGSVWKIPAHLHPPLRQDAVLLEKGRNNPAARAFLQFLAGTEAKALIERFGYGEPTPLP